MTTLAPLNPYSACPVSGYETAHFDSVRDLVDFVQASDAASSGASQHRKPMDYHRELVRDKPEWHGMHAGFSGADLDRLLVDGWAEGAARMDALAVRIPPIANVRRRLVWSDLGDSVDMQRVYTGQLSQAWQRPSRVRQDSLAVKRIVVNVGGLCYVDAADLFWRGAAAVALADTLTAAGYKVEIIAHSAARKPFHGPNVPAGVRTTFTVKSAKAPLDTSLLAAVICIPGFFRSYVFGARVAHPVYATQSGLGSTMAPEKVGGSLEPGDIAGLDAVKNLKTARAWLADQLTALGADLGE